MSLSGHFLRPVGSVLPASVSYSGAVSIEKDKYLTPAHSLKSTRASHSAQYCIDTRHTVKNSFFAQTIPQWNGLSPSLVNSQTTEEFRALLI